MEGIGINGSNGLCEREFGCMEFCIKKLPSIAGTDGSEGLMDILRQAQDDREMPDRVGHDGAFNTSSAHN
jgi:hypothetical protein